MTNPQGSESKDWDFIHVDEPTTIEHWKAVSRGLMDRHGSAWFTLTPLREPWINDYFFADANSGLVLADKWAVTGSSYDNPYLSKESIKQFEDDLSPEERQCRLHGLPLHLAGLVYKEFEYSKHVLHKLPSGWTSWNEPPKDYSVYYAIDPHPQTPHAVLFLAVDKFEHVYFFDEIFLHCSVQALADEIKKRIEGRNVIHAKIDPLAYINDPITESNMAEEFAKHGLFLEKATKALSQGILRAKHELKKENNLFFVPTLKETLWEIQRWSWDKDNKPVDKDDHFLENMYRLLLDDPIYIEPTDSEQGNPVDELVFDGSDRDEPLFEED
jgi:hypothetical protein